ncbi:hypothetical protein SAMN05421869_12755 [Nonomuraea jiangxiensis]|uniref:Uncharacterized protein n=1 Tax=Nonomuraea jiangxiensis TaxID=633440 RepID=A0A1G9L183_9ACTN|nr:hypothetical protein SAMN05421869_12755 [Nonomuraea jiangxiensis]
MAGESPDPTNPPSPSPLNALTVNPTLCPAAFSGTASAASHDEPPHALSADNLPTMPERVLDTSYDCRSGSDPLPQVTSTLLVPCILAFTLPGASGGRLSLNVLVAYVELVSSPLRVTVKVPLGAFPVSNVPEIVWFAPPPATFWLGVSGPSTYRPMFNCTIPVRAEIVTDEPVITWPSEGDVIWSAESDCHIVSAA